MASGLTCTDHWSLPLRACRPVRRKLTAQLNQRRTRPRCRSHACCVPPVFGPRAGVPVVKEFSLGNCLGKDLIEAGVHFGHRASRWNPKMRPYIYARRNLIHIIDVRETIRGLLRARQVPAEGGRPGQPDPVRRHQASGLRRDRAAGPPLRHAVCQRPLAGRHADELPHHPQPADPARRVGGACAAPTSWPPTRRRCSRR